MPRRKKQFRRLESVDLPGKPKTGSNMPVPLAAGTDVNEALRPLSVLMTPAPEVDHRLGNVLSDWDAVEVVLDAVAMRSRSIKGNTIATYRYHFDKIRWYTENVAHVTLSRWKVIDVTRFLDFLADIPADSICEAGCQKGMPGWTPFKVQPSPSSRSDIARFLHVVYASWIKMGYIRINPMGLLGSPQARRLDVGRSIPLDVYEAVLLTIKSSRQKTIQERQLAARDQFVFIALRELGLRATEIVEAKMSAFCLISAPRTNRRFWIFHVKEYTSKAGKERKIPVSAAVWEAFKEYRSAFGLSARPSSTDSTPLILSPRYLDSTSNRPTFDLRESRSGQYYGIKSRQGLYRIVKRRLEQVADEMQLAGNAQAVELLKSASPHWLRHTFGKTAVASGVNMRAIAAALGHANITTTMRYTEQDALDLIFSWEKLSPGMVASEEPTINSEPSGQ